MKNLLLLITLLISTITFSQTEENPLDIVETMPEFKGGEEKRVKFLQKNIKYPKDAQKAKVGGMSYITFVVEKDGSITGVSILKANKECPSCDAEAVRVAKSMPKWVAGEQGGKKVRVQFNMPIKFTPRK